ncbi:hypothetical protein [Pseudomonas sp. ML96]|uniref:hypothetical protein n=1 Tax=Pseudomonas sp. ML96 TaxID=1523503 RepID=UPI0005BBBA63|nr:hypothetical protein [Pseudomonas sp. ML96]
MKFDKNNPDHTPQVIIAEVLQVQEHQHSHTSIHSGRDLEGRLTIGSANHQYDTYKLWFRDLETGLETTFKGPDSSPYREGHKMALAYYADTVVGHQNINTGNYVTIDKQSPEASYIAMLFYSVPLTALWFLFFFVGLSRWNQGYKGIDLITANSPWPGGAHYTALQGKIVTMILGAIAAFSVILMLSVWGSRPRELVESVFLGGVVAIFGGSVVLSIALYQIEKAWIRNRIDFQAYVQETVHAKVAAVTAAARST